MSDPDDFHNHMSDPDYRKPGAMEHFTHGYHMAREAGENGGAHYAAMNMTVALHDSRDFVPQDEYGDRHVHTQHDGKKVMFQPLHELN